jgi:UDP:flavonoid glycosyltransferase YjiC (YdhE family)
MRTGRSRSSTGSGSDSSRDRIGAWGTVRSIVSFLILATAGAGGDLQPLVAAAVALRQRGHRVTFVGDASVRGQLDRLDLDVEVLPPELDLGPRLVAAVRDAVRESAGDAASAGRAIRERMSAWARDVADRADGAIERFRPDAVVTSLFGVEVLAELDPAVPWAVVNSTFAVGALGGRPLADDVAPRALPLMSHYASLLDGASVVLHATDRVFDLGGRTLPSHHRYVGPLGIWEPPNAGNLDELDTPGDPWVLATVSSQRQDDVGLAEVILAALADRPVRLLLTLGPEHQPSELSFVPSNARVEGVLSHARALRRSNLLISHAGHGSVMKALWEGRPMVLVPWGRDQPGVAARAEALGVAAVVPPESASPGTIAASVDAVLAGNAMRERAEQESTRLRRTDPGATAADELARLL